MRSFAALLGLLYVLLSTVAAADTRTFIIANWPDGYGIDKCLASGARYQYELLDAGGRLLPLKADPVALAGDPPGGAVSRVAPHGRGGRGHRQHPDGRRIEPADAAAGVRRHRVHAVSEWRMASGAWGMGHGAMGVVWGE